MRERDVLLLRLDVDENTVALGERAAARVLAGESDGHTLDDQRAQSQGLRECPVDAVGVELVTTGPDGARELLVRVEVVGPGGDGLHHLVEPVALHRGRAVRRSDVGSGTRVARRPARRGNGGALRSVVCTVEFREGAFEDRAESLERGFGLVECDVSAVDEGLGVELADRPVRVDACIHPRLGERRLVGLVVPVAAVADHVDHDVLVERAGGSRRRSARPARRPRGRHRSRGRSAPAPSWRRRWRRRSIAACSGSVVNPSWLFTTMCTVPPTS